MVVAMADAIRTHTADLKVPKQGIQVLMCLLDDCLQIM